MTSNSQIALQQLNDLFQLMMAHVAIGQETIQSKKQQVALAKAMDLIADIRKKEAGKAPVLAELLQMEKMMVDLEEYPIRDLTLKILSNIRQFKKLYV